MEHQFDIGEEEIDSDIICMQILQGWAPDATFGRHVIRPTSTSWSVLRPTNQVEEYQRVGVAYIEVGSKELEDG